ncbi:unnamed protein product [Caenorhabditis bovis]|uniref:Tyrosine-protein phosphatase domain-containing protein n=1 Tax=Caenorhabditis bovis TaxID=2654633 RepID=A0A8S1ESR9_9PELO|nr:unnamed protein product [Caenorhabditis bovis]
MDLLRSMRKTKKKKDKIHSDRMTGEDKSRRTFVIGQGVDGLLKEYNEQIFSFIPTGSYNRTVFDQNTPLKKNRYKDVVCNDLCRVILKDGRGGDYIHANYVRGLQPLYILTQGPLKETLIDFWRMIVQEKVTTICMLSEFIENGRRKCENYFPEGSGNTATYGDFTVVCDSEGPIDEHSFRTMLAVTDKTTEKTLRLMHIKITTWPDKTVAKCPLSLIRTLKILRNSQNAAVIHCSAGIGRTGTLMAVEVGVQALLNNKNFKLMDVVKCLRYCRLNSVQMDTQYMQLAETLLECGISNGYIDDPKLIEGIEVVKRGIADYVLAHPPPIEPKASTPQAATPPQDKKLSPPKEAPAGAQPVEFNMLEVFTPKVCSNEPITATPNTFKVAKPSAENGNAPLMPYNPTEAISTPLATVPIATVPALSMATQMHTVALVPVNVNHVPLHSPTSPPPHQTVFQTVKPLPVAPQTQPRPLSSSPIPTASPPPKAASPSQGARKGGVQQINSMYLG